MDLGRKTGGGGEGADWCWEVGGMNMSEANGLKLAYLKVLIKADVGHCSGLIR